MRRAVARVEETIEEMGKERQGGRSGQADGRDESRDGGDGQVEVVYKQGMGSVGHPPPTGILFAAVD